MATAKSGTRKQHTAEIAAAAHTHLMAEKRKSEILELRMAGVPNNEVARRLGIHETTTSSLFHEALTRYDPSAELVVEERKMQLAQLSMLLETWWPRAVGDLINEPSGSALDRVLAILTRRAKLTGADAPTRVTGADGGPIQIEAVVAQGHQIAAMLREVSDRQRAALAGAGVPADILEKVWRETMPGILRGVLEGMQQNAIEATSSVV